MRSIVSVGGGRAASLLRERLATRLGCQPDETQTDEVDEADQRARRRIARRQRPGAKLDVYLEEDARLQRADGRQDPSEVKAEALACGPNARREQLRQVQRQPTVERSRPRAR